MDDTPKLAKALENEFGVALYHRTGRGITLTEAGKALERHARQMLEISTSAQKDLASLALSPTGTVVIGMPPSVGAVLAAPVVKAFNTQYPRVLLGVMEGFSAHVLDWLITGRIDVAVLYDSQTTDCRFVQQ